MNICGPDMVFLRVASGNEAAFNGSLKALKRALMAAGVRFESTWPCRDGGWRQWIAAKSPDTGPLLADPNVTACSRDDFLAGGEAARRHGLPDPAEG